MIIHANLIW